MNLMKSAKALLKTFDDDSKLYMVTGFSKCRCGWRSETVGGVIEHPSLQIRNLHRMIGQVKDETKILLIEHREETGHKPRMFFMS